MRRYTPWLLLMLTAAFTLVDRANADLTVASPFGDGMVIQRDFNAPVWGTATPGAPIIVSTSWSEMVVRTAAGRDGRWMTHVHTPPAGGPHTLTIRGDGTAITFSDVLSGDVWICSGQSNMEWRIAQIRHGYDTPAAYERDLAAADLPMIRLLTVANRVAPEPQSTFQGRWVTCTPQTAEQFSAVGYFFGQALFHEVGVPIGLIASDWGGTVAEAWVCAEDLAPLGDFDDAIALMEEVASEGSATRRRFESAALKWADDGDKAAFGDDALQLPQPRFDDSGWATIEQPGNWSNSELANFDGSVWQRKTVTIPESWLDRDLILSLGPIDDQDITYVNGARVGMHMGAGVWQRPRTYRVPRAMVRRAEVTIAVRVSDTGGNGGIHGSADQMFLRAVSPEGDVSDELVSLAGTWRYAKSAALNDVPRPPAEQRIHQNVATALWNGMMAPLVPYGIKGSIWYQGESNRNRAVQYRTLFPALIRSWRTQWDQGDFPFYFVQIAPFRYGGDTGQAALLREAQHVALDEPNTGMVVTMDIGNPRDIHPTQKKEVGYRLARWALAKTYGRDELVYSGPMYQSHEIEKNTIRVHFDHVTDGLKTRDGMLLHFQVAGADGTYHSADARIDGETVVVSSPDVPEPVFVRYGWDDDCEPGLMNGAGLPAAPFRTDRSDSVGQPVAAKPGLTSPRLAVSGDDHSLRLWQAQPARSEREAFPLSHGDLGLLVHGGIRRTQFQVYGRAEPASQPIDGGAADDSATLARAQQLLVDERHDESLQLINDGILNPIRSRDRLALGTITIEFPDHDSAWSYRRALDLDSSITLTTYAVNGTTFSREAFLSHEAQAVIIRVESDDAAPFSFNVSLDRSTDRVVRPIGSDQLLMLSRVAQQEERPDLEIATRLRILTESGLVSAQDRDTLAVLNVRAATIVMVAATSDQDDQPLKTSQTMMDHARAQASDYSALRTAHIAAHHD